MRLELCVRVVWEVTQPQGRGSGARTGSRGAQLAVYGRAGQARPL